MHISTTNIYKMVIGKVSRNGFLPVVRKVYLSGDRTNLIIAIKFQVAYGLSIGLIGISPF